MPMSREHDDIKSDLQCVMNHDLVGSKTKVIIEDLCGTFASHMILLNARMQRAASTTIRFFLLIFVTLDAAAVISNSKKR